VFGTFGRVAGRFDYPYSVAVTPDGNLALTDTDNHRIQVHGPAALLANDSGPDGDPISVIDHDATSALGAVVTVDPDGSYTYDPTGIQALGELGPGGLVLDTFTYSIGDGRGGTATTTVTITLIGRRQGELILRVS